MKPTFVLSIDEELIWGSFDLATEAEFAAQYPDLRGTARELLNLLCEFEVSATWAVVGHLFLRSCERGDDGRAHPELVRPRFHWHGRDWFADDPCSDRISRPMWYGEDIVEMLLSTRIPQEIGSHSFSHLVYGDPGCSAEAAASDLNACLEAARRRGISLTSFVFPRNVEGHHDLLKQAGFTCYRGDDPTWFRPLPSVARRAAHFLDQSLALTPPVHIPEERLPGLWNIPGSMILLPRTGPRRLISVAARVAKAKRGIARAIREEKLFHLWFHPFNLAADRAAMFSALRAILEEAARCRDEGALSIATMAEAAQRAVIS